MGDYMAVVDAGQAVAALLRRFMVPDTVYKEEQIGLCSPKDSGEYSVGIYLYDVRESCGVRNTKKIIVGESRRKFPSIFFDLYYMLIPYSKSDLKYRCSEEHKILGKMIQILNDYPDLNSKTYETELNSGENTIQVEILDISFEDKMHIWSSINEAARTALYCRVHPVEIESERIEDIKRVQEVQMNFNEKR